MGSLSRLAWSVMVMCSVMIFLWLSTMSSWALEFVFFLSGSVKLSLQFIFDPVAFIFSSAVFLISWSVFLFACDYMKEDPYFSRFMFILFSFVLSMNLLIFSGSLFSLLLGWDGLGLSSFALIIYYQSRDSLFSGFHTLLINRLGDALIMVSSFYLLAVGDYSNVYKVGIFWFLGLFIVAATTKSAQYPFSSWLPAAMAAPTPVSALVHSSTLVTAGIYLIIRFSMEQVLPSQYLSVLVVMGALTSLLGGWCACVENDLKKIIALSTLSQLGVMVFALGMGLPMLAFFHLLTHAMFKALLFLCGGVLLSNSFGTQDLRLLGSSSSSLMLKAVFNISGLCLIAAPFLSSFYSKHMILDYALSGGMLVSSVVLMLFSGFFTARYVSRMMRSVSFGYSGTLISSWGCSYMSVLGIVILCSFSIFSGWFLSENIIPLLGVVVVPGYLSSLINLGTILGLSSGIFLSPQPSYFLSSMFFLTPLYLGVYGVMKGSKVFNVLDIGWLEPKSIKSDVYKSISSKSQSLLNWPISYFSFGHLLIGLIFLWYLYLI